MHRLFVIAAGAFLAFRFSSSSANAEDLYLPDANGCKVYDPTPKPNEAVTWSGGCLDGYADGSGVVQWLQSGIPGTRLEGTLVRGRFDGHVAMASPSGARFEGGFRDGERSGKGLATWANGATYDGDWLHDERTGTGVLTRANGDRYEGDFVDGKWSGKGTFTSSSGDRYTGDWINNKREGKGQAVWGDGSRYEGAFVNDAPANPKLIVRETYSTQQLVTGSLIPQRVTTGISVPVDKSYAELTVAEQRRVKSLYQSMGDDDVPPYPLYGQREIIEAAQKLQKALRVAGELTLAVTVNAKGEPINVEMLRSPDADMTKVMAEVLMQQKYSPASCKGVPCQMQYPFRIHFVIR